MCAYKLCRVEFKYWGMQAKIERFIHDIGQLQRLHLFRPRSIFNVEPLILLFFSHFQRLNSISIATIASQTCVVGIIDQNFLVLWITNENIDFRYSEFPVSKQLLITDSPLFNEEFKEPHKNPK